MYAELGRPPLRADALRRGLVREGSLWQDVQLVQRTGSTNADLVRLAPDGADGLVLVAEKQTLGRGRLDRGWSSPPRAGLTFSVLLRPPVPPARWGWLPLLAGVSVLRAVRRLGEVAAWLKWPNDLLVGEERHKAAGVLAEVAGTAVVIGVGLNVSTGRAELPVPAATSLTLAGAACTDRDPLLRAILRELEAGYRSWCEHAGDAVASGLHAAYGEVCDTLGRDVSVSVPALPPMRGRAEAIDDAGRLLIRADGQLQALAAGDVTHLCVAAAARPGARGEREGSR